MANVNNLNSSVNTYLMTSSSRFSGLASGIDTDSIVAQLMKAERVPLDKMEQQRQLLEWQRDAYREINRLLDAFNNFLSVTQANGVGRQATFLQKIVTSSNPSAVTARSLNSTAIDIQTRISVTQLASNAAMWSYGDIRRPGSDFSTSATIASQIGNFAGLSEGETIDGKFTLKFFVIDASGNMPSEGVTVEIDPEVDSLDSVIRKINTQTDLNAFFDTQTGRLSLVAKNTGDIGGGVGFNDTTNAEIVIDTGGDQNAVNFLKALNFHVDENNLATNTGQESSGHGNGLSGKNAQFTINGMATYRSANTFQINGFEYTLHQVADNVTLTSTTDTDSIYKAIEEFVNQYNDLISKINSKLTETRYYDYPPLTEAQKKELDEEEIKLWTEKAKSGLLRGDSILTNALYTMRTAIYSPVSGLTGTFSYQNSRGETQAVAIDQLAKIGITTSSNYRDNGKLVISDPEKLKAAIAQNPQAVYELFNKAVYTDASRQTLDEAQSGLVPKLRAALRDTIKAIEAKAGNTYMTYDQYSLGKRINDYEKRIEAFKARLLEIEVRYYRQFTAMEQAIQRANLQSSYLLQQFSSY